MRRGWLVAVLAVLIGALAPAGAVAAQRTSPRTSLLTLAAAIKRAPIRSSSKRAVRADLIKAARGLKRARGGCAAVGAVEAARLATRRVRGRIHKTLIRDLAAAERALRKLRGVRACAPAVHSVKLKLIHPRFNPKAPPGPLTHEQGGAEGYTIPADRHAKPLGPQGPPTDVSSTGAATIANVTDPLQLFTTTDVGELGLGFYPQEPQVAKKGSVVLYSGNTNGAVSFDGGAHFQTVNPGQIFGNDQTICCDSVVRYAPSIDRFIWLFQYWCPIATVNGNQTADCHFVPNLNNRYRIAVISPSALLANRSDPTRGWTVYELTASSLRSTTWLDYPDMSVGAGNLYITCDEVGQGGLNIRLPLRDLTRSGSPSAQWFRSDAIFWRSAESSGSTGIFLKNGTDSQDIAYVWPDALPFPIEVTLPHATRPDYGFSMLTPSGQDWNDRAGSGVVKGATMQGSNLWVAWAAGRYYNAARSGPSYPLPHVQVAEYDLGDLLHIFFTGSARLSSQQFIWSSTTAYSNPILATNSDGDVALVMMGASAHSMPAPYVSVLTNRTFTVQAARSLGPTTAVVGDYAGLTVDYDNPARWVAANTYTTIGTGDAGPIVHWLYTDFGRGPNPPPPAVPPTTISVTGVAGTAFSCCFYGDTFHTAGVLSGGPPNASVTIDYSSGGTEFSHNVTTDAAGNFTDAWTVPTEQQDSVWAIVAHYAGDASHGASNSDPFYQTVQVTPG